MQGPVLKSEQDTGLALRGLSAQVDLDFRTDVSAQRADAAIKVAQGLWETQSGAKEGSSKGI